jgi:hypothetical protein
MFILTSDGLGIEIVHWQREQQYKRRKFNKKVNLFINILLNDSLFSHNVFIRFKLRTRKYSLYLRFLRELLTYQPETAGHFYQVAKLFSQSADIFGTIIILKYPYLFKLDEIVINNHDKMKPIKIFP